MNRALTWLVLLFAVVGVAGGAVVGTGSLHPSPYVDDWSDVDLRDSGEESNDAIQACLDASGRAILREGVYTISPGGTQALVMNAGDLLEGAGMGVTILRMVDDETGAAVLLDDDCTIRNLTIDAFDDASTLGARASTDKHRLRYENVEFSDLATGIQGGTAAVNGIQVLGCKFTSGTTGFTISNACTSVVVSDCVFDTLTTAISLQNSPLGVLISGNRFTTCTTAVSNTSGSSVSTRGNFFISGTTSYVVGTGTRNEVGENYWAFDEIVAADVTNTQTRLRGRYYGTASPSAGTWLTGDVVHNSTPGSSGATATHWVCSVGGTSGTWQAAYRGAGMLSTSVTWDPDSLDNGQSDTEQVTVTGAAVGDFAMATHAQNLPNGLIITAQSIGSDLVDVTISNVGGGTQDVASGTVYVRVIKQ